MTLSKISDKKLFLLLVIFLACKILHAQSCTYLPYPYFSCTTKVENNKLIEGAPEFPKFLILSNTEFNQIPESNVSFDSLIGLSVENSTVDPEELLIFVNTRNVKHLELKRCVIEDVHTKQDLENLKYLKLSETYPPEGFVSLIGRNTTLALHSIDLSNERHLDEVFSIPVVVFSEVGGMNRTFFEMLLNGSSRCVLFDVIDFRECNDAKFDKMNESIKYLSFSNCHLISIPWFIQNIKGPVKLGFTTSHVRFNRKRTFPNVRSVMEFYSLTRRGHRIKADVFPNLED